MTKAYEKTLDFIKKNVQKHKEKYMDGMKHNLFEWEDLLSDFKNMINSQNQEDLVRKDLIIENQNLKRILKNHGIYY